MRRSDKIRGVPDDVMEHIWRLHDLSVELNKEKQRLLSDPAVKRYSLRWYVKLRPPLDAENRTIVKELRSRQRMIEDGRTYRQWETAIDTYICDACNYHRLLCAIDYLKRSRSFP